MLKVSGRLSIGGVASLWHIWFRRLLQAHLDRWTGWLRIMCELLLLSPLLEASLSRRQHLPTAGLSYLEIARLVAMWSSRLELVASRDLEFLSKAEGRTVLQHSLPGRLIRTRKSIFLALWPLPTETS